MGRTARPDEIGFVYKWTNKINDKWYIGSHLGVPTDRYVGSGKIFKKAWKKYGSENFKRSILYQGRGFRKYEESLLHRLNAAKNRMSYNYHNWATGSANGDKHPKGMLGKTHSEEYKAWRSTLRGALNPFYGKHHTEETRRRWSILRKGCRLSKETIEKIRNSNLGQKRSEEIRRRMSEAQKGRIITEAHRQKISNTLKGRPGATRGRKMSEEQKLKISRALQGRKLPEETKIKMRIAQKKRWTVEAIRKRWTVEARKKMSLIMTGKQSHRFGKPSIFKGKHHTEKAKERIRQALLGRRLSKETRQRMSESQRKYWQKERDGEGVQLS